MLRLISENLQDNESSLTDLSERAFGEEIYSLSFLFSSVWRRTPALAYSSPCPHDMAPPNASFLSPIILVLLILQKKKAM